MLAQEFGCRVAPVRSPVIQNQVQGLARIALPKTFKKGDERLTVVLGDDFSNDFARVDIKGCDEIGCSVTAILELDLSRRSSSDRLVGSAPFQSLNGSLLVNTYNSATGGSIGVERDNAVPFSLKVWVLAV